MARRPRIQKNNTLEPGRWSGKGKRPIFQLTTYRYYHDVQWALYLRVDGNWHIGTAECTRGGTDLDFIEKIMMTYPRYDNVYDLIDWIEANYYPEERRAWAYRDPQNRNFKHPAGHPKNKK